MVVCKLEGPITQLLSKKRGLIAITLATIKLATITLATPPLYLVVVLLWQVSTLDKQQVETWQTQILSCSVQCIQCVELDQVVFDVRPDWVYCIGLGQVRLCLVCQVVFKGWVWLGCIHRLGQVGLPCVQYIRSGQIRLGLVCQVRLVASMGQVQYVRSGQVASVGQVMSMGLGQVVSIGQVQLCQFASTGWVGLCPWVR